MKMRRLFAFTRRALHQFRHDRRTLAFVLVMPLLMIIVFGYTFGGEPKGLNIAVVNNDEAIAVGGGTGEVSFAEELLAYLDDETFIVHTYSSQQEAEVDLHDARVWAILSFSSNFSSNLAQRFSSSGDATKVSVVNIMVDGTNPTVSSSVIRGIQGALQDTLKEIQSLFQLPVSTEPITIDVSYDYAGGNHAEFIDSFAPAVISFALMMVTTMLTIILFVNERRYGTLQRLLVSPAKESEIVLGYALAFAILGIFQSIVVLVAAILLFHITIIGNVFLALFVVILLGVGHQGLGILLSSGARNELQAIQFIPLIIFPSVLLAGLFWPVESIPGYLQPLSYLIPLRYAIDAERAIMLRGWGLEGVWIQIVILIFFAVVTLVGSIVLLKRRRE